MRLEAQIPHRGRRLHVVRIRCELLLEDCNGAAGITLLRELRRRLHRRVVDQGDLGLDSRVNVALLDLEVGDGIGHDHTEDEAPHVRPKGDGAAARAGGQAVHSLGGKELLEEPQRQHQPGRRLEGADQKEKPIQELDLRMPVTDQEGAHDPGDGAGCADQRRVERGIPHHEHETCDRTRRQIKPEIEGPSPYVLDEGAHEEEHKKVAQEMHPPAVQELVGQDRRQPELRRHQAPAPQRCVVDRDEALFDQSVELRLLPFELEVARRPIGCDLAHELDLGVCLLLADLRDKNLPETRRRFEVGVLDKVLHRHLQPLDALPGPLLVTGAGEQEDHEAERHDDPCHPRLAPDASLLVAQWDDHGMAYYLD